MDTAYISLLYVVIKNNETMKQIMLVVGSVILCLILSDGVTDFIVKPLVARFRPSWDPIIKYSVEVVNGMRNTQYGFFQPMLQIHSVWQCFSRY